MSSSLIIQESELIRLTDLFKILSNPTRIQLLYLLFQQEASVGELAEQLGATQSAISHQLILLKSSNLVKKRREGKQIYYFLSNVHVQTTIEQIQKLILSD